MMRMGRSEDIMYDTRYWKRCEGITVKQFHDYLLANIPSDAVMDVCDDGQVYMLWKKMGAYFLWITVLWRNCRNMKGLWNRKGLFWRWHSEYTVRIL